MPSDANRRFWNRIAERYAARQISDVAAYEALLADAALRLRPTDRVLEIGCGTGGTAIHLARGVASYTATDFSAEMIRIARAKPAPDTLRLIEAEAAEALADGPFDAVCAFNVLHLVDDPADLLRRIEAGLRPGGLLISKTWCFADLNRRMRMLFVLMRGIGLFPDARWLTADQLRATVTAAGLVILDERVFGAYRQNPYIVARKPGLRTRAHHDASPGASAQAPIAASTRR